MSHKKNKQQSSTLVTFPHLITLHLTKAHADYAEQFLFEKNTRLPRLLNLDIGYESLAMVTNNFTNDPVHLNFAKLKILYLAEEFVRPENFHEYFPFFINISFVKNSFTKWKELKKVKYIWIMLSLTKLY
jgi:hypothetical protein